MKPGTKRRATKRVAAEAAREDPPAPPFPIAAAAVMPSDLSAVARVLAALPQRLQLALLLVPYRDDPESSAALRALPCGLPIVEARAGEPLEPGRVYVLPCKRPLLPDGGRFVAAGRARRDGATAVSAVFSALAQELGRHAIAVLLSGSGDHALDGLRALRGCGGCSFVQEPTSALFDELPRAAIAQGLADLVLAPEEIGRELAKLARRRFEAPREPDSSDDADADESDDEGFRRVLALLKGKFHIDLGQYKRTTIRRRVLRRMAMSRIADTSAYADHLRAHSDALKTLHDDLFIHVTRFFRDPESFQALRELVFPALLKDRDDDPIRVWVPGCSTGEEAYSLAMALSEYLQEQRSNVGVQIFATDISEVAIEEARRATYAQSMLADVGAERVERFFERVKDGYKVRKELRELCVISRHDVTSNPPFARLDLVSCRNVLIYFGASLQKRIVPIFHYALKPGGFLWLGRSETPGASSRLFSLVDKHNKIYVKVPTPPAYLQLASSRFVTEKVVYPHTFARDSRADGDLQKSADQLVLFKYGPPGVVVNCELEILQFRGRTAPFLEPPLGQPTHSLLKMVHPELLPVLRPLLELAKKQNLAVRKEGIALDHGGARALVNLEVVPLNPLAPERERQYLVLFESSAGNAAAAAASGQPPSATRRPHRSERGHGRGSDAAYVEQLQQEIDGLREYQQTLIEQFESAQEELTSANEEMQATNEELQSTNEELETAKEELQSANEELTTMNDELQTRNAELVVVNEKLARGEDRFRLMVEGVKDYAIYMLDPDGHVSSWNEGARRLKGYETSEVMGRHYSQFFMPEDIAAGLPELELEHARIEGRCESEGWRLRKDGSRFWANVVVTRINDGSGALIGFSKVTRDLTERKRVLEDLERSEQRFKLMVSGVRDYAIFMLDPEWRIASWNEGARRLKGYEEAEIRGKHFSVFYPPEDVAGGKIEREVAAVMAEGRVEDEGWRVRKDGTRFWANVVITRVVDPRGQVLGFTKVTRDLTERKRNEQALRAANESLELRVRERTKELELALRARDEFLSIASHEFRTPLTALKLQLQRAKRSVKLSSGQAPSAEQTAQTYDKALKQAVALEELVEDLLDVSRIKTGRLKLEPEDVELSPLVEDVVARFADQLAHAQMRLALALAPGITGSWDRRRLVQVLVNLISNAIKYAPKSELRVTTALRGSRVEIAVADSGPGIERSKQELIFERFERADASASAGGLGLGLFIARRIVEAHEGRIRVQSEPGQGARFIVELPREPRGVELGAELGDPLT